MTLSPSVTWPSAAITTLVSRRTQSTVVERMRRPEEREFALEADLEPADAVEPWTTDERIDISSEYNADGCCRMGSNLSSTSPVGFALRYPATCTAFPGRSVDEQFASFWRRWNLPRRRGRLRHASPPAQPGRRGTQTERPPGPARAHH